MSDDRPSSSGPAAPGTPSGAGLGNVPVLALLAAAGLGYVALDLGAGPPAPAAPTTPTVVAGPAPVAAPLPPPPLSPAVPELSIDTPSPPDTAPPAAESVEEPPSAPPATEDSTAPAAPEPVTAEAALGGLREALASVRCADLRVEVLDGGLGVAGTVTSADDRNRVQRLVDALPAGLARPMAVAVAASELCEPLLLLEPLRTANTTRGLPLAVSGVAGDGGLIGGQDLVLDVRTTEAAFPQGAHLLVDYFTVDGGVVHLLPNPLDPAARLEAGTARRLGARDGRARFWTIGPPFGHELIVVVASSVPLFPAARPEAEPAAAYLPDLKRALAGPGADGALAATLFITTRAP